VADCHPTRVRQPVLIVPWAVSADPFRHFFFSAWGRLQAAAPAGALSRIHPAVRIELATELPRISAPTLIVRGVQDFVIPAYRTAKLEALIPDTRSRVLDAGHALLYEKADHVVRLVNGFTDGFMSGSTG
jgi:pimeloyl-ACP methyl ester carboxylesterase